MGSVRHPPGAVRPWAAKAGVGVEGCVTTAAKFLHEGGLPGAGDAGEQDAHEERRYSPRPSASWTPVNSSLPSVVRVLRADPSAPSGADRRAIDVAAGTIVRGGGWVPRRACGRAESSPVERPPATYRSTRFRWPLRTTSGRWSGRRGASRRPFRGHRQRRSRMGLRWSRSSR